MTDERVITAGTSIFAGAPPDDRMVEQAREYINEKNLTANDVKIARKLGTICVILKRDWDGK